ncbi:MAG: GNAT family N-acetyltransferase [Poseidonibacter sp.]|uniref:GNAT family N-acetyltransferase n=1 Tax=Poseidonibacter sp. TaxID=2321188 RepID=UPI00359CC693
MKIIDYNKSYLKEIPTLFTNTIHKICNKEYTKEQLTAWANPNIDYDSWKKRLDKTKPYLALIDDTLVGFVEFYDDYIDCFYVHHEYQGQGIGKVLMNHILDIASKNGIKILSVDASITAKAFFETFGFEEVSKNEVKRDNQILINYSLELNLQI